MINCTYWALNMTEHLSSNNEKSSYYSFGTTNISKIQTVKQQNNNHTLQSFSLPKNTAKTTTFGLNKVRKTMSLFLALVQNLASQNHRPTNTKLHLKSDILFSFPDLKQAHNVHWDFNVLYECVKDRHFHIFKALWWHKSQQIKSQQNGPQGHSKHRPCTARWPTQHKQNNNKQNAKSNDLHLLIDVFLHGVNVL